MKEDKKSKEKKVYAVVNGVVTDETEEELDARYDSLALSFSLSCLCLSSAHP